MGHRTRAIDQHTDLTSGLAGELGQLPRELVRDQAIGGDVAPEKAFERADLARLQPMGIAEDADGLALPLAVDPKGNLRNAATATQPICDPHGDPASSRC